MPRGFYILPLPRPPGRMPALALALIWPKRRSAAVAWGLPYHQERPLQVGGVRKGSAMATTIHRIRAADRTRRGELELLLNLQGTTLRNRRQILRDGLPTTTSGVMDFEEHALDAEEQGVGYTVLEITSRTVQGIETALQRLKTGAFGSCSDCRCKISDVRLRALPFAALCHACQERRDMAAGWRGRVAFARTGSLGQ